MKKNTNLLLVVVLSFAWLGINYAQSVVMNEIYSRGVVDNPDWIEIYNGTSSSVDLTGYKIYDSGGQAGTKPKKEFPAGTTIPAGGFYVIVTDDADASGFGLSSAGETVWLENASSTVIDEVAFTAMDLTQSYGRIPDGGSWQLLNTITRGVSNLSGIDFSAKLNEIYSRGTVDAPDWIEIYNSSSAQIDISGYKIYDSGGQAGTKPKKEFAAGTTIPANGYSVIVTDDTSASGFGLSSGGETVWFENAQGVLLDSIAFTAMDVTQSYGRYPDGSANLALLDSITRGSSNYFIVPSHVKMNEIYSRGTTDAPDWIEIHNSAIFNMDLSGYKIYDSGGNAGTKPKKEFPSGATIPANGFYVIVTDDADASGFGLSSAGEEVWFEDPTGVVVDNVVFTAMETTQSYSRIPDGSGDWQLVNTITRGESNNPSGVEDESLNVTNFELSQNYPNPFNPSTLIKFSIPEQSHVKLTIYNVLGNEVKTLMNGFKKAGNYVVEFNAGGLSSGVYFYTLYAGKFVETKKLNLIK
ncbi:MAG: lamin tail domain-containing protein [Ignavibacteria bacterium]|nr:lamin tail domain-containing protein [Ignavibacteria bacterium]